MHMFDDFKNQPVSCLEFLLYVLHVSEVFRKIFSKAYSMWIVFKIRPLIYKCSATSQAKTTWLWREAQNGRRQKQLAEEFVIIKPVIMADNQSRKQLESKLKSKLGLLSSKIGNIHIHLYSCSYLGRYNVDKSHLTARHGKASRAWKNC